MRSRKSAVWLALAVACSISLFCPSIASAQMLASQSNNFAQQGYDIINDVFVGCDLRGPYMLSWKNIEQGTDDLMISGRKLVRGQEYTIDCASGMIAFQEPLARGVTARVTYHKLPGKAVQNGGAVSMPLNAKLLNSDSGSLDLLGFYRGADGKSGAAGSTVFGLSGERKLGDKSTVSTAFITSQGDDKSGAQTGLMDRSMLKLGTSSSFGQLAVKGSIQMVGQNFTAAKDYGAQQSKSVTDLSGAWGKPTDVVYASFSYKEQGDTAGVQKGANQTNTEQKLVVNLENAPTLSYSHVTADNHTAAGQSSGTATDTYKIDQKLGSKTTAGASFQKTEGTGASTAGAADSTRFSIQSTALQNVSLRASMVQTQSDNNGASSGMDLGMKLTPTKNTTLDASRQTLTSDQNGQQTKTSLALVTSALNRVQLRTSLVLADSTNAGSQSTMDVGLNVAPSKQLSLQASHNMVDSDQNGTQSKTTVALAAGQGQPLSLNANYTGTDSTQAGQQTGLNVNMKAKLGVANIEGGYGDKQDDTGKLEESHTVRINAKPADFMKVSAGLADKVTPSSQQSNMDAKVEISPNSRISLAHAYSQSVNGTSISTVRNYTGQIKPFACVEIAGGYKNRQSTAGNDLDTTNVKLALGSAKCVKITGQYAYNPEDQSGIINRVETRGVGLDMKLGILGLTGGYTQNDEYATDRLTREAQVGLKLALFSHGNLTTGYKLSEAIADTQQSTVTYSIGYTHIIGSSFNMSVSGEMTQYQQESAAAKGDYKAVAKLGMSF